jgi:hypothetical protein
LPDQILKGVQNYVRQSRHPTNMPLLLKTEKVDAILIVFLLNYWANHGFKLCQNNPIGPVVSEMKTFFNFIHLFYF